MGEEIRILFLAADPSDLTRTRLAAEYQVIRDELRKGRLADRFVIEAVFSVKIPDMTGAVLTFRPHIIHFSGHGSADGELIFENSEAKARRATPEDLEGIFMSLAGRVDAVILNACFSEEQAAVISRHIPYVVGMKGLVTDQAAICFSLGFYQSLSAGETLADAFKHAGALLQAERLLGECEPVIKAGPGAENRLDGPWGHQTRRESSRRRRPIPTVVVRNSRAGRDLRVKTSPGAVEVSQSEAGRDMSIQAKHPRGP